MQTLPFLSYSRFCPLTFSDVVDKVDWCASSTHLRGKRDGIDWALQLLSLIWSSEGSRLVGQSCDRWIFGPAPAGKLSDTSPYFYSLMWEVLRSLLHHNSSFRWSVGENRFRWPHVNWASVYSYAYQKNFVRIVALGESPNSSNFFFVL